MISRLVWSLVPWDTNPGTVLNLIHGLEVLSALLLVVLVAVVVIKAAPHVKRLGRRYVAYRKSLNCCSHYGEAR